MTDQEKAQRITILTQMLLGHPGDVTADRLDWYLKVTACVPMWLLQRACLAASRAQHETDFAPSAGRIVKMAISLDPDRVRVYDEYIPRWYARAQRRIRDDERPQEIGARGGSIDSVLLELSDRVQDGE